MVPLHECRVEQITRIEAAKLILEYEWLQSMPRGARAFYGLRTSGGDLIGATAFALPHGTAAAESLCGPNWADKVITLARGCCTGAAHRHAPSYLTASAVRLAARDHGWRIFTAYADPEAYEAGTIYRAANWLRLAPSASHRSGRVYARAPNSSQWIEERELRRRFGLNVAEARSLGWQIEYRPNKQRFVTFAGPAGDKRHARRALQIPVAPWPLGA